jgi:hypothetical protein
MKTRLAAFAGTVRRMVRLRPLAVTLAMMMIHIASQDRTLTGTINRVIQFAIAYALVAWAMKPNIPHHAEDDSGRTMA